MGGVCYDALSVAVGEGSTIAAGAAFGVGSAAAVVADFSSTLLTTFLVCFAAALRPDRFPCRGFDFLETLVCLTFFFAALLALRTILIVIFIV